MAKIEDRRGSDSGGYASPVSFDDEEDASPINEFYNNRCIFITGATGFVGKVLLEKLLRSCQGLKTVYILMRPIDGKSPKQRLEELFTCRIFKQIKREWPRILDKVTPISGDITLPNLGISEKDTDTLIKQVSVVFHSAATVRFDDPLKKAVDLNLLGTQRVLHLCKKMTKLVALVHVSTAYTYCNRKDIDEVIYPEKVSPQNVIDLTRWMDEDLLETILPKLMDGRPTTYHYSKALAECLLQSEGAELPIAIVRPSIVTAAFREPIPGWVDGANGPTTYIIMTGKGLLRTMLVYEGTVVDWMPVDFVANFLIAAGWHIASLGPKNIKVYNCTSSDLNRVTWADIERTAYPLIIQYPFPGTHRFPGGSFKTSHFMNSLSIRLQHSLPAYILDFALWICGYETQYVNMVRRMERAAGYIQYFTTREWTFNVRNLIHLRDILTPKDKEVFNFDIRQIEWLPYFEIYILGVRQFILGDTEASLPATRRHLTRLYYAELLAKWGSVIGIIYLLLKKTNLSQHLLWTLINMAFTIMQYMPRSWLKYLSS